MKAVETKDVPRYPFHGRHIYDLRLFEDRRRPDNRTGAIHINTFVFITMFILILLIAVIVLVGLLPDVPEDEDWYVDVEGKVDDPQRFNMTELRALPVVEQSTTLRGTGEDNEPHTYRGVSLWHLLNISGVHNDSGSVLVTASDGYAYTLDMDDVRESHESDGEVIIVAYEKDGKSLKKTTGGPLRLIVPKEYAGEYNAQLCVKHVLELKVN